MSRDILPHTRWKSTLGTPRAGILSMIQRLRSGHWFAYEFLADRIQYLHDELIRTEGELAATQKALLAADDLVVAFEAKAPFGQRGPKPDDRRRRAPRLPGHRHAIAGPLRGRVARAAEDPPRLIPRRHAQHLAGMASSFD
jgi:hypothetical protein